MSATLHFDHDQRRDNVLYKKIGDDLKVHVFVIVISMYSRYLLHYLGIRAFFGRFRNVNKP